MNSPPGRLLGQFSIPQAPALRRVATTIRREVGSGQGLALRQATIVSSDGGSPPTCTISFDGEISLAGVRRLKSYTPVVDELVEVLIRDGGNPFILGALA